MALRYLDSFDHYATADLQPIKGWIIVNGNFAVNASAGQNSTNGLRNTFNSGTADYIERTVPTASGATAIVGLAMKTSAGFTTNPFLYIMETTITHVSLSCDASGHIVANGQAGVLGTSTATLSVGVWYYIELKVFLHDTTGTVEVRVNGSNTNWLNLTSKDTNNGGTSTWNKVRLRHFGNSTANNDIDDLYIVDGSGAVNNDFLGPIRIKAVFPDGAGNYTQMTPKAGSNYQNVSETAQDGDTTYNSEQTAGQLDTYTFGALGVTGAVRGVQTNLVVRSNGGGAETIAPVWRISSLDYPGTTVGISTSYTDKLEIFETSPATASAWTVSEIDGAELGPKLVS